MEPPIVCYVICYISFFMQIRKIRFYFSKHLILHIVIIRLADNRCQILCQLKVFAQIYRIFCCIDFSTGILTL